ncbi:hypothetical protein ABK040_005967 [Willaertia magna]
MLSSRLKPLCKNNISILSGNYSFLLTTKRNYATLVNKDQTLKSKTLNNKSTPKSNFSKSQEKLSQLKQQQKIERIQQKTEQQYIKDANELEKTLKIQQIIDNANNISESTFYRQILNYPHFKLLNLLQGTNSSEFTNIYVFSSRLRYEQFIESLTSKTMKKEYQNVKLYTVNNLTSAIAKTCMGRDLSKNRLTIDNRIVLSSEQLQETIDWSKIIWTELLLNLLKNDLNDLSLLSKEITPLQLDLNKIKEEDRESSIDFVKKQKLLDEKKEKINSLEKRIEFNKKKLYEIEKLFVLLPLNRHLEEEINIKKEGKESNILDLSHLITKHKDKRIIHIYSALDIASNDVKVGDDSSVVVVKGVDLFEGIMDKEVDVLRFIFFDSKNNRIQLDLNEELIKSIIELGRIEKEIIDRHNKEKKESENINAEQQVNNSSSVSN